MMQATSASAEREPAAPATGESVPAARTVGRDELPLCCPMPDAPLWNMHPKVYLPIEASGQATCPYCGARYVLKD